MALTYRFIMMGLIAILLMQELVIYIFRSASNLYIGNAAGTQSYITAADGGAVDLRYNGSTKLATTSTGIDVTGTVTSDGLTVDGSVDVNSGVLDLDSGYAIRWGGSASGIYARVCDCRHGIYSRFF